MPPLLMAAVPPSCALTMAPLLSVVPLVVIVREAPPPRLPAKARLVTDSSLPTSVRPAVLPTVMAAPAAKWLAPPLVLSVPPVMLTVVPAAVPASVVLPCTMSVPAPRLALTTLVPPVAIV